jgi:hypothetical protein
VDVKRVDVNDLEFVTLILICRELVASAGKFGNLTERIAEPAGVTSDCFWSNTSMPRT